MSFKRSMAGRALGRTDELARGQTRRHRGSRKKVFRDTRGILLMNFPDFSWGRYAQDQAPRGKVIDFRVALQIGQAVVSPDAIVFGDVDGVCIVPREIESEVFAQALEKARGEKSVNKSLDRGMSARAAFDRHGIL